MTSLRHFSFILLLSAAFVATQARVLAMGGHISEFCDNWDSGEDYECTDCNDDEGIPPDWNANGSCDFSGIEDEELLLQTAAAYCEGFYDACEDECSQDYPAFVADYYESVMNETEPCYQAATSPECFEAWAQGGCIAGAESTWECSCGVFFVCECG
jgi:hypothetical protein